MEDFQLNSFLKFGYFPNSELPYKLDLKNIQRTESGKRDFHQLAECALEKLESAVEKNYHPGETNVIPLSGGYDSRVILGLLRKFSESKNLYTYTFGVPGAYDYELANRLAKIAGTRHTSIDLRYYHYSTESFIDLSKKTYHQTRMFGMPPFDFIDELYGNHTTWSGFMGDLGSGQLPEKFRGMSYDEAHKMIVNLWPPVQSMRLHKLGDKDFYHLFEARDYAEKGIGNFESFMIKYREFKLVAPHIFQRDKIYRTPLIDPEYLSLMFDMPTSFRDDGKLYFHINDLLNPDFRHISVKAKGGYSLPDTYPLPVRKMWQQGLRAKNRLIREVNKFKPVLFNPMINYIDFHQAIFNREDFRSLLFENFRDLQSRKIIDWVDFEAIWKSRRFLGKKHLDAILLLASLEIHLKAGLDLGKQIVVPSTKNHVI